MPPGLAAWGAPGASLQQSLPGLYFRITNIYRKQRAIAEIACEKCCLPHSPRVKPGCLPAALAQHPALPDPAHASSISASGCGCCSARGCVAWLRTPLRCLESCCTAQDLVAQLRTLLCGLGPCHTAWDHLALLRTTLHVLHRSWLLGKRGWYRALHATKYGQMMGLNP